MKNTPLTRIIFLFISVSSLLFLTACTDDNKTTTEPVPDTTAPELVIPDPRNTEVDAWTPVELNFNEDIELPTNNTDVILYAFIGAGFNIKPPCDTPIYKEGTKSTLLINCNRSLTYSSRFRVDVEKIVDLAGNVRVEKKSLFFTTKTLPKVLEGVTLRAVDSLARSKARSLSLIPTITIPFNVDLDPATVDSSSVLLTQQGQATPLEISIRLDDVDPSIIVVKPLITAPLKIRTTYNLTIKSGEAGVKGLTGNALTADFVKSLTPQEVDISQPSVLTLQPSDIFSTPNPQNKPVPVDTSFVITFNESMNPDTFKVGTNIKIFDVTNQVDSGFLTSRYITTYHAAYNQLIISPKPGFKLSNDLKYRFILTNNVEDSTGNILLTNDISFPASFNFSTGPLKTDVTPPYIVSVTPGNESTVQPGTQIIITFSEPMNLRKFNFNSDNLIFSLTQLPYGVSRKLSVLYTGFSGTVDTTGKIVTFTQKPNPLTLQFDRYYSLKIKSGALGVSDRAGNTLGNSGGALLENDPEYFFKTPRQ